jgi:hypothetical protein
MPLQCHFCGAPVTVGEPIPREGECDSCRKDLKCCRNCRHYDPRYNNSCVETQAELVEDKERRNFCEYFSFSREPFQAPVSSARSVEARAKLDALFGGKPSADRVVDARSRLESLFRKPGPDDDPGSEPK